MDNMPLGRPTSAGASGAPPRRGLRQGVAVVLLVVLLSWVALLVGSRLGSDGTEAGVVPDASGDVFGESFRGRGPSAATWVTRSRAGELEPSDALLEITGQRTPAAWGAPGMYSVRALPRRPGRSLAAVARAFVGAVDGPLFLLSPRRFPADPPSGGYGAGFASALGAGGNGGRDLRLTAVTPGGAVPLGGYVAENHNYLFTTTLRPSGSYHFVSGGAMGTFPEATLMWVNERGADGSLYAGVDSRRTQAGVASVRVLDLGGEFATQDGLAVAVDTFRRGAAPGAPADLGTTSQGGFLWRVESGDPRPGGAGLTRRGPASALATIDPGVSDGLVELSFDTPRGPFAPASLYVRYRDAQNWWRVACGADAIRVEAAAGGAVSTVYQTAATSCRPGATHRLVVRAHGERLDVWLDDRGIGTEADGLLVPAPGPDAAGGATRVGVGVDPDAPSPVIRRLAVWPR
ncbi:MAG TPA: hypothetical protein VNK05_04360, partial [Chloroflexota bacterium]|nr:hypothetical protein [Chloroflexota bacterium]